jgi:hypothetical protein
MENTMKKKIFLLFLISLFTVSNLFSEDFPGSLQRLMGYNAKSYAMPLVEGFGSSLNAGLYKKASVSAGKLIPVGFDIGLATIFTSIPDDKREFTHRLEDFTFDFNLSTEGEELKDIQLNFADIYDASDTKTANIASDKKGVACNIKSEDAIFENVSRQLLNSGVSQSVIDAKENTIRQNIQEKLVENFSTFSYPKGLGISSLGAFALQANVRLPFIGLEVTGRYLPSFEINKDIGKFNLYGVGLRKSLPVPIIDVTAGAFLQKMEIGDIFELNSTMIHLEVGKSISVPLLFSISPYAGAGYAMTNAKLNYSLEAGSLPGIEQDKKLHYEIEPDNNLVFTLGVTAQIIPLTYLNLELNQSDYTTACLKLGLIIK